jgi:hypothetical protein
MNIRDNVEVCGYCGHDVPQKSERSGGGKARTAPQRSTPPVTAPSVEPGAEGEEEEEDGGLSRILQQGEQILICSLNISVKKFFFHAYLTNKRIFLIDTQEVKIKVTAKDISRDTIAASSVESSENGDPVLVLSIKSADDEIKTMKLVFAQNGTDRAGEIEDWIAILNDEPAEKKSRRAAAAPASAKIVEEPEEEEEEEPAEEPDEIQPAPRPAAKSRFRQQELEPTRKPLKSHERQPPVKRLIPMTREPEPESEPEQEQEPEIEYIPEPAAPQRRTQFRTIEMPARKKSVITRENDEAPVHSNTYIVKRPEVTSAVRTAMKHPVQPVHHPVVRSITSQPEVTIKRPLPEPAENVVPVEIPTVKKSVASYDTVDTPQFCFNCGKKLPAEANFCPGCGTRLGHAKTEPSRQSTTIPRPAPVSRVTTNPHVRKVPKIEEVRDDDDDEPVQKRPVVKKTQRGSDMTILHKFLRR